MGAAPVSGMFLSDDFNGTADADLTTGTTETPVAGTWTEHPSSTGAVVFSTAGTAIRSSTVPAYYTADVDPADADYSVTAVFKSLTAVNNSAITRIAGRFNTATVDGYAFGFTGNGNGAGKGIWRLAVYNAGTPTTLGSSSEVTLVAGTSYTLVLTMSGSTISATVGGVHITGSPFTDSSVSAAGRAGVVFVSVAGGGATGTHIESIQADN